MGPPDQVSLRLASREIKRSDLVSQTIIAVDAIANFIAEINWPDKDLPSWLLRGISVDDDFSDVGILLNPNHKRFLKCRSTMYAQLLPDRVTGWLELPVTNPASDVPQIPMIAPPRGAFKRLKLDLSFKVRIPTDHLFPRSFSGECPLPRSLNARLSGKGFPLRIIRPCIWFKLLKFSLVSPS